MMTFEEYMFHNYNKDYESYKKEKLRLETPFYYETGVWYYDRNGSLVEIIDADYLLDGRVFYNCREINGKFNSGYQNNNIYKELRRKETDIKPLGNLIPNTRRFIYVINKYGELFEIMQHYGRNYNKPHEITLSLSINSSSFPLLKYKNNTDKRVNYNLYSNFGNTMHLKETFGRDRSYDYRIIKDISVRKFKEIVFKDPNIKLKCQLLDDYGRRIQHF